MDEARETKNIIVIKGNFMLLYDYKTHITSIRSSKIYFITLSLLPLIFLAEMWKNIAIFFTFFIFRIMCFLSSSYKLAKMSNLMFYSILLINSFSTIKRKIGLWNLKNILIILSSFPLLRTSYYVNIRKWLAFFAKWSIRWLYFMWL
jgi:hypothetical protein